MSRHHPSISLGAELVGICFSPEFAALICEMCFGVCFSTVGPKISNLIPRAHQTNKMRFLSGVPMVASAMISGAPHIHCDLLCSNLQVEMRCTFYSERMGASSTQSPSRAQANPGSPPLLYSEPASRMQLLFHCFKLCVLHPRGTLRSLNAFHVQGYISNKAISAHSLHKYSAKSRPNKHGLVPESR